MKLATECVRTPADGDPYGASSPPIYQTATFRQPSAVEFGEYDYTRTANPTRTALERQIARLERGAAALAFSSGMAALAAVTRLVASGDEILAGDDLYGGTFRLLGRVLPPLGIGVRYVDTTDLDAVARAFTPATRLVLVESPTNPLLRVTDLSGLAGIAHDRGALLAVDNSLLSPVLQRPLELGADLVIHSATKFLAGHADVIAGAVVARDEALAERLAFVQNAEGSGLAPFDAWLVLRGIKTLALRVERQSASARRVAEYLGGRRDVERVLYPGAGAVVSFTTGDAELSRRIVEAARLFTIAVSFGGVGSVASLPCRMSHASTPPEVRERHALPEDLVRLSVGIEDVDDLVDDLDAAFYEAGVRGQGVRGQGWSPVSLTPDP
jgi:cystathionine beta-lyase